MKNITKSITLALLVLCSTQPAVAAPLLSPFDTQTRYIESIMLIGIPLCFFGLLAIAIATNPNNGKPNPNYYTYPTLDFSNILPDAIRPSVTYTLSRTEAQTYLSSVSYSIETAFRHSSHDSDLPKLRNTITNQLLNNSITYSHTATGTLYSKEKLDMLIRSAVIEYIEQRAYNYSYMYVNNSSNARKIAESMRNNAMVEIEKNGLQRLYTLARFVGADLDKAIKNQTNQTTYTQPTMPTYPKPAVMPTYPKPTPAPVTLNNLYPSDECCICIDVQFTTTEGSAKRIFLIPCGHDMCKDCARTLFVNNKSKNCPICRSAVNIEQTLKQ